MTWIWFILLGTISLVARRSLNQWMQGWQEPTLRFWRNWGLIFFAFWATLGLAIEGTGFMQFVAAFGGIMGFFSIAELLRRGGERRREQYNKRVSKNIEQLRQQAATYEAEQQEIQRAEQAKQRRSVKTPIGEPTADTADKPDPIETKVVATNELVEEKRQAATDIVQLISAASDMWEKTQQGEAVSSEFEEHPAAETADDQAQSEQEPETGQVKTATEPAEPTPAETAEPEKQAGPKQSGPVTRTPSAEAQQPLTARPAGPVDLGLGAGARQTSSPVLLGENRFKYEPQLVSSRLEEKPRKPVAAE